MAFNGTEGGEITLDQGSAMTAEYRRLNPNSTIAHFFGKEILERILDQENCVGIRAYYGINEEGKKELILVGADSEENDLTNLVVDLSAPCPKACSKANALNS